MYGANIIAVPPKGYIFTKETADFEERLGSVLKVTSKAPDRLFPILLIHPDEEDILSKIDFAVESRTDNAKYDEPGIADKAREGIYGENLPRFPGIRK